MPATFFHSCIQEFSLAKLAKVISPDFYRLPGICKNAKSTKGKNGFEYFKDSTYDSYSISNSFYTSPTRLAGWIYAIQEVVYKSIGCDDN